MNILSLLVFMCLGVSCYSQSHNLVLGQATYGDVIVQRFNECKYAFPLIIRKSTLEYPLPGATNIPFITAIDIRDNMVDGTGGFAALTEGGVGQRYATITLKSQRGYGFNFTVTIYGRFM